ncbi:hypothetical protein [Paucilactobacillus sp. N302-9]
MLNRRKKFVWIIAVIIVVAGVLATVLTLANQHKSQSKQTKSNVQRIVQNKGSWQGKNVYAKRGQVTMKISFKEHRRYQLIETNTVSQCWQRVYQGKYSKKGANITAKPDQVIVKTFANKQSLKRNQVSAQEVVSNADMYHQFGNQQISRIKLQKKTMLINHDHEKIKLTRE